MLNTSLNQNISAKLNTVDFNTQMLLYYKKGDVDSLDTAIKNAQIAIDNLQDLNYSDSLFLKQDKATLYANIYTIIQTNDLVASLAGIYAKPV